MRTAAATTARLGRDDPGHRHRGRLARESSPQHPVAEEGRPCHTLVTTNQGRRVNPLLRFGEARRPLLWGNRRGCLACSRLSQRVSFKRPNSSANRAACPQAGRVLHRWRNLLLESLASGTVARPREPGIEAAPPRSTPWARLAPSSRGTEPAADRRLPRPDQGHPTVRQRRTDWEAGASRRISSLTAKRRRRRLSLGPRATACSHPRTLHPWGNQRVSGSDPGGGPGSLRASPELGVTAPNTGSGALSTVANRHIRACG